MAVTASKLLFSSLDYNCYEIGHTWSPVCSTAICMFTSAVVKQSFKLYVAFYLVNFVIRKQKINKENLETLVLNILRSTCFLGVTAFFHLFSTCALRHSLGKFFLCTAGFIPGIIAGITGICVERDNRRSALALYVANVATETIFRMLVNRDMVRAIPHGEILLFSCSMALFMHSAKQHGSKDVMSIFLNFLFGKSKSSRVNQLEWPKSKDDNFNHANNGEANEPNSSILTEISHRSIVCLTKLRCLQRHNSCDHPYSCFYNCLTGFIKSFCVGYAIKTAIMVPSNIMEYIQNPTALLKHLVSKHNMNLGLFLGCFTGMFKTSSCILRWFRNKEEHWHALPAGFLAGTSMYFFKNSAIALYVAWKVVEIYYRSGMEAGYLPQVPGFMKMLYALSCGILFHCAVVEPHNVKPTYYKFLIRITCGLIEKINRELMTEFLQRSNTLNPNYLPALDKRHMTSQAIEFMKKKIPQF